MLEGKVAFVTGSTRGIGWAVAERFAEEGAAVVVHGRSPDQVAARVQALRDRGATASGAVGDVADPNCASGAIREIFSEHRRLDVLVNNAGFLEDAYLGMIAADTAERLFSVNALGALHMMQSAARLMVRGGGGSIVNIASIVGRVGNAGQVAYAGSKAAVLGMTRSAAKELAARGVRVNAIAPGLIDTDMTKGLAPDVHAQRLGAIAMGRIGTVHDVAAAALFFASDLSAYVTGQVLGVDGGMLI
jgi:3-oxoacyl-[acyl-carrier protein] reductase